MKLEFKHITIIAALYAGFILLATKIIDPYRFLTEPNSIYPLLIIGGLIFTLSIGVLSTFKLKKGIVPNLLLLGSMFSVPAISGLILLLFYPLENGTIITFLSSFIILAFLPITLFILFSVFNELKNKISISNSSEENSTSDEVLFELKNNKGKSLIKIPIESISSFEASDNYVLVHHFQNEKGLKKSMLRTSMKLILSELKELDSDFLRVHKSHIINPRKVEKVTGKAQAYKLKMKESEQLIPVSRSFDIQLIRL